MLEWCTMAPSWGGHDSISLSGGSQLQWLLATSVVKTARDLCGGGSGGPCSQVSCPESWVMSVSVAESFGVPRTEVAELLCRTGHWGPRGHG